MKKSAFFDVDYVVVKKDLFRLLGEELIKLGRISKFKIFIWYLWLIGYRLNMLDGEKIMKENVKEIEDIKYTEIQGIAYSVFKSAKRYILPKTIELIQKHTDEGYEVVFLSGNFRILIEPIAEFLGVKNVIAVELENDGEFFTGRVVEPVCIGRGKTYWMKKFSKEKNIDLTTSYFYTDSFYDLDTLLSVGFPVATNPDPRLKSFAKKMGWKIIYTIE